MTSFQNLQNWKLKQDEQGILWLELDRAHSQVNTLNTQVLDEFQQILDWLETGTGKGSGKGKRTGTAPGIEMGEGKGSGPQAGTNTETENRETEIGTLEETVRGLVIGSRKPSGFAAGADIQQLKNVTSFDEAYALIAQGQRVFNQLAKLKIPTLALIQGYCLGGGLELALACRYRVAIIDPKTKLGLPEVMLGVHPGWGGSVRLPRLIGGTKAMELILSGSALSAETAAKLGIVDIAIPAWDSSRAVQYYLLQKPRGFQTPLLAQMTNWDLFRPWLAKWILRKLTAKVNRQHYPAPFAALENWSHYGIREEAFLNEAKSIAQLMISPATQNLVRVFNLQERLKSFGRDCGFKPLRIHVVGAGVMGGDIACWCSLKGFKVSLQDPNRQAVANAFKRGLVLFKKILKDFHRIQAAQDNLIPDQQGLGISEADLIIEAIIEKLPAKQDLFKTIDTKAKRGALLATNTSTIPLDEIAPKDRDLIGLHFFNPVAKMLLVEVVSEMNADPKNIERGIAFARALDKLPLPVKSSPGFLVNRVLMPYLQESLQLLDEGVLAPAIDQAILDFGMPMGPIELMDAVGLDICLDAFISLSQRLPHQAQWLSGSALKRLQALVEKGHLGKKTGQGFYVYRFGKAIKEPLKADYRIPEDAVDRMILRMINEALACLREKVVEDADLLDAGLIFGAGFAPFRGGPIHYVLEQGEGLMLQRLNLLVQRYGDRFLPDPGWNLLDAL